MITPYMKRKEETHARVEATKVLKLDERVEILQKGLKELNLSGVSGDDKKINKWLKASGYEPMMFAHAARIVMSRQRTSNNSKGTQQ